MIALTAPRDQDYSREETAKRSTELPAFVDNPELKDPTSGRRVPVRDTEPKAAEDLTNSPATGVASLARSANRALSPVFEIPRVKRARPQSSQILQQWEGTVVEVKGNSFGARLKNITDPKGPEEWATILLDEISESDRERVQPGSIFYWSVGYLIEPYLQRRTASTIYFRQLPVWSAADLDRASKAADRYRDIFSDGSSD